MAVVLPCLMFVIWGITVGNQPNLDPQIGYGIALFGNVLLFTFLGFCHWYGNDMALSSFTHGMFILAIVIGMAYCLILSILNYTYNGTTAIYMAANYIFGVAIMDFKSTTISADGVDVEKYQSTRITLKIMRDYNCFNRAAELPSVDEVMNRAG